MIKILTLIFTLAIALVGIFFDSASNSVKHILAVLSIMGFILAIFIEVQGSKHAAFTKRALENLIKSTTPSKLFADAVKKILLKVTANNGLIKAKYKRIHSRDDSFSNIFEFYDSNEDKIAYYEFDHEKLAELSLLDNKSLPRVIHSELYEKCPFPSGSPLDYWDELAIFISNVAFGLYPYISQNGKRGVWAQTDKVFLGVPCPPELSFENNDRVIKSQMDGQPVCVLTFQEEQLYTLKGKSYIDASKILIEDLKNTWGKPPIVE